MYKIIIMLFMCLLVTNTYSTSSEIKQDSDFYYLTVKVPKESGQENHSVVLKTKDSTKPPIIINEIPNTYILNSSSKEIHFQDVILSVGIALDLKDKNNREKINNNLFEKYLLDNNLIITSHNKNNLLWKVVDKNVKDSSGNSGINELQEHLKKLDENSDEIVDEYRNKLRKVWPEVLRRRYGSPYTEAQAESVFLDPYRLLNFQSSKYPQQFRSPIKVRILEILDAGQNQKGQLESTMVYMEDGYIYPDCEKVNNNLEFVAQNAPNINTQVSNQLTTPLHDILISVGLSKGIKDVFVGYLEGIENNCLPSSEECQTQQNAENNESKNKDHLRVDIGYVRSSWDPQKEGKYPLPQKVISDNIDYTDVNKKTRIFSISSYLDFTDLESILEPAGTTSTQTLDESNLNLIEVLTKKKEEYIIISALANQFPQQTGQHSPEEVAYFNEDSTPSNTVTLLKELVDSFPNVFLVSTTDSRISSNTSESGMKALLQDDIKPSFGKRPYLSEKGIDFFTVEASNIKLQPPFCGIEPSVGDIPYNNATSYAVPALAAIIYNMMSLSPNLSSSQIKDILKRSSHNYKSILEKDPEQLTLGYRINSDKAYEFVMGSLLSNAYLSNCKNKQGVITLEANEYNEDEWIVDCSKPSINACITDNSTSQIHNYCTNIYEDKPLSSFYSDHTVAQFSYFDNSINRHRIKTTLHGQSLSNEKRGIAKRISFNNIKVAHDDTIADNNKRIYVGFTKKFEGTSGYNDTTYKYVIVNYKSGLPIMDGEYVVPDYYSQNKIGSQ